MNNLDTAIDTFWHSRNVGGAPHEWRGNLTGDEGFRIQIAIQGRYDAIGDRRIGWKVAATNPAVQRQLGVSEPAFGSLRMSKRYLSGDDVALASLAQPHIECELCFELNEKIARAETQADVLDSVDRCFPAFELIEKRVPIADFGAAMADNAEHTAIVLGAPISDLSKLALDGVECQLTVNDEVMGVALSSAVLENPLNSVLWLKRRLERYGQTLPAGTLVMTGSFLRQQPFNVGDRFRADFEGVGRVEVTGVA